MRERERAEREEVGTIIKDIGEEEYAKGFDRRERSTSEVPIF